MRQTVSSRTQRIALIMVLLMISAISACSGSSEKENIRTKEVQELQPPFTLSFVIPAGTGAKIDAGETVEVLPKRIEAKVGDTISIVNNDSRDHVMGPFFVGKGEELKQRFTNPGTFTGNCTTNSEGAMELVVAK